MSDTAFEDVEPQSLGQKAELKNLATKPLEEAAKDLVSLWKAQDPLARRRIAQWRVNRLRRQGVVGARITKDRDQRVWRVWAPPGSAPQLPTMNKAARLCRRMVAHIFADPPIPEATPSTDSDEDRASAEINTRILIDLGSEANLGNDLTARLAVDFACEYGSGFRRFYVDPTGGGSKPMAIQASQQATTIRFTEQDEPMVRDGVVNPETGEAFDPPYVRRYVKQDGTLTDDQQDPQVRRIWLPSLEREILTGAHVRPLPVTAMDVWECEGLMVAGVRQIRELKRQFPDAFSGLEDEDKEKLDLDLSDPEKELLPHGVRLADLQGKEGDDAYTRVITCYMLKSPEYPHGLYFVVAGDGVPLIRDRWEDPNSGEALDLPVDHFKQLEDGTDFYGRGMMDDLGPGNELRAVGWGALLDHLDRMSHRRIFLPTNSTIHPKELQSPTATVLPVNPGGVPTYEELPDFPVVAEKMNAAVAAEMDDESNLQQVGQAMNPPSVQSGLHAQRILEQVQVGLSSIRQNTSRGLERGWRIQTQLVRAFFPVPQIVSWVGDDGAYKQREWTGADLRGTKDFRLQRGSFTGLTPSAKAALAESFFNIRDPQGQSILSLEELRRIVVGNVGGLIGVQDDPHWQRIRRQIEQWKQGPSPLAKERHQDWQQRGPQIMGVGPDGQPQVTPSPLTMEAGRIFQPLPTDDDPTIARIRYFELGRLLSGTSFGRHPAEWQQPVVQEYLRMRQAAGIQTIAEQAAAAQQAQQAQQAAQQQTEVARQQLQGETKVQQETIRQQGQIERERIEQTPNLALNVRGKLDDPGLRPFLSGVDGEL